MIKFLALHQLRGSSICTVFTMNKATHICASPWNTSYLSTKKIKRKPKIRSPNSRFPLSFISTNILHQRYLTKNHIYPSAFHFKKQDRNVTDCSLENSD